MRTTFLIKKHSLALRILHMLDKANEAYDNAYTDLMNFDKKGHLFYQRRHFAKKVNKYAKIAEYLEQRYLGVVYGADIAIQSQVNNIEKEMD